MEKIETIIREIKEQEHQFYWDCCNEYLGTRAEYSDGYYPKIGEFELKIYLPDGWYKVEKCFCEECKEKYLSKLKNVLNELDFEKDG